MKHRRRPARRSAARAVGVVALLVATLMTGRALDRVLPAADDAARGFERSGVVGEQLRLRYGTVEAGRPEGSTQIVTAGGTYLSTGVYVVVPVTFTAAHEPQSLSYAAIRDATGRVFEAGTQRNPFSMDGPAQPGVPRHTQVAVELPVDAVAGAQLVLALQPDDDNHRRDDVAVIDLGLTGADAQRWAAEEEGIRVRPATEGRG
ncbi:hypothetical protein [Phytoactinopolyspora halotolerans]|uniref:DUF4352 domain-containing protein n=1 Tax=Phytoactinopolyspora halotolerans TaxID=1981512 RepID=A0A6L9S8Q5_9ACTN|nr:hypothetical protein [Phytoactinopolyspora halotolerans]NEE00908.1 hypothetical protein [Phytoactinopolyspora halotolerans]